MCDRTIYKSLYLIQTPGAFVGEPLTFFFSPLLPSTRLLGTRPPNLEALPSPLISSLPQWLR